MGVFVRTHTHTHTRASDRISLLQLNCMQPHQNRTHARLILPRQSWLPLARATFGSPMATIGYSMATVGCLWLPSPGVAMQATLAHPWTPRSTSAMAMVKEAILCSPCLCSQYDMQCPGTNIIHPLQESTRLQRQRCSSLGRTCSTRSAVQGIEAPCITSPPVSTLHFSHCASVYLACSVCNARSDAARGKRSVQILSVLAALSEPVELTPLVQDFTVGPVLREAVRRLTVCLNPYMSHLTLRIVAHNVARHTLFLALRKSHTSRNSFMSGRRPSKTKVWNFRDHFREAGVGEDWVSLPGWFKNHGYFVHG
jgi:hypothetical protein